jgi:hypothetical protein
MLTYDWHQCEQRQKQAMFSNVYLNYDITIDMYKVHGIQRTNDFISNMNDHKDERVNYYDGSYEHRRNVQVPLNTTAPYIKHTLDFRPSGRLYNFVISWLCVTCCVIEYIKLSLTKCVYIPQRRSITHHRCHRSVGCFFRIMYN